LTDGRQIDSRPKQNITLILLIGVMSKRETQEPKDIQYNMDSDFSNFKIRFVKSIIMIPKIITL
jgi:hypothetical protein